MNFSMKQTKKIVLNALKKNKKTSKGKTRLPIYVFYAFLCVKFSCKKQRSLKLSKRTKTNQTTFFMRNKNV